MSTPRTTVVIPCYNHGRFVADAVRSCLAQQDADVRVVIVDDGSDDGATSAACDACAVGSADRVIVVHQANRGLAAARNAGAEQARQLGGEWAGEYLTFLDADDWIEPTFVSKLHEAIMQRTRTPHVVTTALKEAELATVAGASRAGVGAREVCSIHAAVEADDSERVADPGYDVSHAYCQERLVELHTMVWAVPDWDPLLMLVTNLHPVTTLIRRECFEAVGGFDETMREGYEDWDLWLKFVERGWSGVRVREPLFIWRRHSQNTMIVEAGKRHERLFGQLVANHPGLYMRHAPELLVLSNRLLRQSDANWLDESGEAIVIRDTRRHVQSLITERDAARNEIAVQQRAMLDGDASSILVAAQERERLAARVRELTALTDTQAREQVALLGTIGERARERNEARSDYRRAQAEVERVEQEREAARAEVGRTSAERDAVRLSLDAERAAHAAAVAGAIEASEHQARTHAADRAMLIAAYESKPVIRFSRAMHRLLDRLPGFVSRPVKGLVRRLGK